MLCFIVCIDACHYIYIAFICISVSTSWCTWFSCMFWICVWSKLFKLMLQFLLVFEKWVNNNKEFVNKYINIFNSHIPQYIFLILFLHKLFMKGTLVQFLYINIFTNINKVFLKLWKHFRVSDAILLKLKAS